MKFKKNNKFIINSSCISTSIEDRSVILNIENGKYYELNHTASFIWNCLKQDYIFDKIIIELMNKFNIDEKSVVISLENTLNQCIGLDFIKKI
jgi:hypothetical protein